MTYARDLEGLAERMNTVVAIWHDAYSEWEVRIDGRRVLADECAQGFWHPTLADAVGQAHDWLDAQRSENTQVSKHE